MCHCEERSDVAISGRQLRFRRQLPHNAARPCEIAPQGHFLALRAQGATSGFRPPRNDKLGGHCLFNIGPHFPPGRWREGHAPPLQRMTGLVKFSTFQFHFPRAAPLHMCYPILQKGLLRGSCSRPFAPREGNRRYQRWTTVPASPRTAAPACASEAIMACPPVLANETAALTFGSMEPGAKWPSSQ